MVVNIVADVKVILDCNGLIFIYVKKVISFQVDGKIHLAV